MTMHTTLLLKANPSHLKWKQYPLPLPPHRITKPVKFTPITHATYKYNSSIKCVLSRKQLENSSTSKSPLEVLASTLSNALKALRKPAIAAVLVGLLLMYNPNSALAAAVGPMGRSCFSSCSTNQNQTNQTNKKNSKNERTTSDLEEEEEEGFSCSLSADAALFLFFLSLTSSIFVSLYLLDRSERIRSSKISILKLQVWSLL
ncbi:uncharacterized protein LOC133305942 [Gastrolobium bilobum]|uniref:uncharacterized protein LOC133305942 n=1 Tax=Gastrolobium bilobum TaxID=150636 RepID=UPI002AB2D049|nr:uncharacterized protein LOC133305942 [Gastrolobium bilobum]